MTQPLNLPEETAKKLSRWLYDEITLSQFEFSDRDAKATKYAKMYDAEPDQKIKTFPWYKASNLVAPLCGIMVDAIYSRLINTMWALEPFWSIKERIGEYQPLAESAEDFLEYVQQERIRVYQHLVPWMMELVKVGSSTFNLMWRTKYKRYVSNDIKSVEKRLVSDGPAIETVPWTDVFYRGLHRRLEDADWKGYRTRMSWHDLKRWEMAGVLEDVDRIKTASKNYYQDIEERRVSTTGQQPLNYEYWELYNIQCGYDIDDDGYPEELFVVFEPSTESLLYVGGHPYQHGECTMHMGIYYPKEHTMAGVGVCQMLEPLSEAMTAFLNQTIDNATAANTKFIKARKGSGVKPGTRIYPMKVFELQDLNDLMFESVGEINPSSINLLTMMQQFSEKRVGVADYNLGHESNVARYAATATSTLALLNESARRFDTTMRDIREVWGRVGMQVLQLYAQNRPKGADYQAIDPTSKAYVQMLLKFPPGLMRDKVVLEVTASSTARSRAIEQQSQGQWMQLLITYYTQMVQGLELATNPQVSPAIREFCESAARGATETMRRLGRTFEMKDLEKYLPDMDTIFTIANITTPPALVPGMGGTDGTGVGQGAPGLPAGGTGVGTFVQ